MRSKQLIGTMNSIHDLMNAYDKKNELPACNNKDKFRGVRFR